MTQVHKSLEPTWRQSTLAGLLLLCTRIKALRVSQSASDYKRDKQGSVGFKCHSCVNDHAVTKHGYHSTQLAQLQPST